MPISASTINVTPALVSNSVNINIDRSFGKAGLNLEEIKKIICYNQSCYIQFNYLLGLTHRDFKDEVNSDPPDQSKIFDKCETLWSFTQKKLSRASKVNFAFLSAALKGRHKSQFAPRICIKVAIDNADGEQEIVELYREEGYRRAKQAVPHKAKWNTGFDHVENTGKFYLNNNIPEKAKAGKYKNPRLSLSHVKEYKIPFTLRFRKDQTDPNWCNCWTESIKDDNPTDWDKSCYKSTLIIPMTLRKTDLTDEFQSRFFKGDPEQERISWGLVCLDHPVTDYFDDTDVAIGYMIADLLSLYFFSANIHTKTSETMQKVDCMSP